MKNTIKFINKSRREIPAELYDFAEINSYSIQTINSICDDYNLVIAEFERVDEGDKITNTITLKDK